MFKKNNLKFFIIIFFVICLFVLVFFVNFNNTKNNNIQNDNVEEISLSTCTGDVVQKECYIDFPKPILNWNCELAGEQTDDYFFIVQLDNNRNFNSPEIDTGEVKTSDLFYEINQAGLESKVSYNWRIKVKNSAGIWSDWAEADESFITSPICE